MDVTAAALKHVAIEIDTDLGEMVLSHDKFIRDSLDDSQVEELTKIAFAEDSIYRHANSVLELQQFIRPLVTEGVILGVTVGGPSESVTKSFEEAVLEAAELVSCDLRRTDSFSVSFQNHVVEGKPGNLLPARLKPKLKEMEEAITNKFGPALVTYQDDVAILKKIFRTN